MVDGGLGAWVEAKHPRDEKGQFSSSEVAKGVSEQIAKHPEGFSYRPQGLYPRRAGQENAEGHPTSGIMVSEHPNFDHGTVIDMTKAGSVAEREKQIQEWVDKAWPVVSKDEDLYLGGWVDQTTHEFHGDVSRRCPESQEKFATRMGQMNNQKSIYHIGRNELIQTGGTGKRTEGTPPRWVRGESHSVALDEDEGGGSRDKVWPKSYR